MTRKFDDSVFMSIVNVTEDNLQQIISKYIENTNIYISRIALAIERNDYRELVDAAHPLASSSAALGFVRLAELVKEAEETAAENENCQKNLSILQKTPDMLKEELLDAERYVQDFLNKGHKIKNAVTSDNKRKICVMHIDDDPVVRNITEVYLNNSGYFETKSFPGIDAAMSAAIFIPDVILIDYMMPDTEGMSSLLSLKSEPRLSDVPVIFVTGMEEEVIYERLGDSISGYIKKPYSPKKLIDYIINVYEKHNGLSS